MNLPEKKSLRQKSLYECNICRDTGYIIKNQENSQPVMTACKCMKKKKNIQMWKNTGISIENIDKSFNNFYEWSEESKELKRKAISYYVKFDEIKNARRNSLLLSGRSGCGKTHISLALAYNFIKNKDIRIVYMPYRDIITELKQNNMDPIVYKGILMKYQKAELLLIDDLYKGRITLADINIMFELINYRYLNNLPMIISTEFKLEDILDFDEAIGSRIYEMSKNFIVEIHGEEVNYRLRRECFE